MPLLLIIYKGLGFIPIKLFIYIFLLLCFVFRIPQQWLRFQVLDLCSGILLFFYIFSLGGDILHLIHVGGRLGIRSLLCSGSNTVDFVCQFLLLIHQVYLIREPFNYFFGLPKFTSLYLDIFSLFHCLNIIRFPRSGAQYIYLFFFRSFIKMAMRSASVHVFAF